MLPSITASSSGHWNQDGSRRWQRVMRSPSSRTHASTSPRNASAKPETFARPARQTQFGTDRADGQRVEDLLNQPEALLDLADAHPDAGIDIAGFQDRNVEVELTVRPISGRLARIKGASARTSDIAAGAELPCQLGAQNPGARRCGLAARRCCRKARSVPGASRGCPATGPRRAVCNRPRDRARRRRAARHPSSADGRNMHPPPARSARAERRNARASARMRRHCRRLRYPRNGWRDARARPSARADGSRVAGPGLRPPLPQRGQRQER